MASSTNRKRATAADIVAAVKVGAIAPDAEVVTAAELAEHDAAAAAATPEHVIARAPLSATEHECAIPGCRHGAAHAGHVPQPDRQVKLQCPTCGAVARMTAAAIAKTQGLGITCAADGVAFVPAARRKYGTNRVAA